VAPEPDYAVAAATAVRRGVTSLGRKLRLERGSGLTALELSVLGHLHRRGPMNPGELATAERVQPQSLTRTLASLEAVGLVTRRADPHDGRRSLLVITDTGRDALRDDMQRREVWLRQAMTRELTGTECELLRLAGELLERLASADPGT
jgi:DNA-binding MarR family transcriptional regulator